MASPLQQQSQHPVRVLQLVAMLHNGGVRAVGGGPLRGGPLREHRHGYRVLDEMPGVFDREPGNRGLPFITARGANSLDLVRTPAAAPRARPL